MRLLHHALFVRREKLLPVAIALRRLHAPFNRMAEGKLDSMSASAELSLRGAYIDLVKRTVTNYAYLGGDTPFEQFRCVSHYQVGQGEWKIDRLARPATLLSKAQLDLIEQSVVAIEARGVPGDFIEAGIWRGGAVAFMRAMLKAYDIPNRRVFASDSFAGIPKNTRAVGDPVDAWRDRWVAGLEEVRGNIERLGLLDDRIKFVPGFFADSLPSLANETFALMRLDSDSYDSVEESLVYLYPQLSSGGVIIIDDWHLVGCKTAVMNYRERNGIAEPLKVQDGNAYWLKR